MPIPAPWRRSPDELFTPQAIAHWGDGQDRVGPHAIAEKVRESVTLFDDVSVSLLRGPIVDGDWIAARWQFAGSYLGGVAGVQAMAGTRVCYTGMDLFRVEADRLAEYWPHGNDLSLMQQLDALG